MAYGLLHEPRFFLSLSVFPVKQNTSSGDFHFQEGNVAPYLQQLWTAL